MKSPRVGVVGAGTMGQGISHVFALMGCDVRLVDQSEQLLSAASGRIAENFLRQERKGLISASDRKRALGRIETATDLSTATRYSDLIIEAVPEDRSAKARILRQIDEFAPAESIIASNTSSLSITYLASCTSRPDRVIGMHFFNPAPLMKLVEIVRGVKTSENTFQTIMRITRDAGKVPIAVQDYPGFVSNRILMPMINEAVYCLMERIASAEDIDSVMTLGMAHPMGPLALADFVGLDVCLSILETLHRELGDDKYRPCPLLRRKVAAGHLGQKSGEGFFKYDE